MTSATDRAHLAKQAESSLRYSSTATVDVNHPKHEKSLGDAAKMRLWIIRKPCACDGHAVILSMILRGLMIQQEGKGQTLRKEGSRSDI